MELASQVLADPLLEPDSGQSELAVTELGMEVATGQKQATTGEEQASDDERLAFEQEVAGELAKAAGL